MPTTDFVSGTTVTSTWLNKVDAHVFESILIRAWAYITNSGAAALADGANIATAVRDSLGSVSVTFTTAPAADTYAVTATPRNGSTCLATIGNVTTAGFSVFTWDDTGALVDSPFYISVIW